MTLKTSPSDIKFSDIRRQLKHTSSGSVSISEMMSGLFGVNSVFLGSDVNAGTRTAAQTEKQSSNTGGATSAFYMGSKYVSQHNKTAYNHNSTSTPEVITPYATSLSGKNVNLSEYIGTQGNIGAQTRDNMNNANQITNTGNMTSVSHTNRFNRTPGKSAQSGNAVDDCNFVQAVFSLKTFTDKVLDLPTTSSPGDFIFVIAVASTGAVVTNYLSSGQLRDYNGNSVTNAVLMSTYGPLENKTGSDTYQFAQFWKAGSTPVRYIDTKLYSSGAPSNATYTVIGGIVKGVDLTQSGGSYFGYGYSISKSTSSVEYRERLGGGRYGDSGGFVAEGGLGGNVGYTAAGNERRMIFNISPFTAGAFAAPTVGSGAPGTMLSGRRNTTTGGARFAYAIGANESGYTEGLQGKTFISTYTGAGGDMKVPRLVGSSNGTVTFSLRVKSK